LWSSGTATQLFLAERLIEDDSVSEAWDLAAAVQAWHEAHRKGNAELATKLGDVLRLRVAKVIAQRSVERGHERLFTFLSSTTVVHSRGSDAPDRVLFLCLDTNAARSMEDEKEWRSALELRGLEYIDPVSLVDPRDSPPPKELASLHFNDVYLAYIQSKRVDRRGLQFRKS
jgi:hypothetical protein